MAGGMILMCFAKSCHYIFSEGSAAPSNGSKALGERYTTVCPKCGAENVVSVAVSRYNRSLSK